MKRVLNLFLLVISVGWAAQAYLTPGLPGGRPAPYPGHAGGGLGPRPPMPPPPHRPMPPRPMPPRPMPPAPRPPMPPPPSYGTETKSVWIGRAVWNETLPLRQLAGLGAQYNGWEVVSVRASTRPNDPGRTVVQLVAEGRSVATQVNPGYQILLYPQQRLILGANAQTLQLSINGGTYIDGLEIQLRRGGGYNPPPPAGQNIEINLYRSVFGNDRLDLTTYIDMYRYRGYSIQQVIITANARYNTGVISLLINGFDQGRVNIAAGYSQQQSVWLRQPMVIGQGADSVVLYTTGDMTIERVTLVVR